MSIWTPSGEHQISSQKSDGEKLGNESPENENPENESPGAERTKLPEELTAEEQETLAREFEETRGRIASTPVEQIVATHIIGLYELAVIHLRNEPPNLDQATVAVDALAAVVQAVGDDLGEYEEAARNALAEIQMAYVNVSEPGAGGTDEPEA